MQPSLGAALSVALRPSVRLSRASDFLKVKKPQKFTISWKQRGQE